MSKIQEFIDAWNTAVDVEIAAAQSEVDAYLAARQTAIALTDPFTLKMPKMRVFGISDSFTIDGFDVTTLGQLFDWSYPANGPKNYSIEYTNYRSKPEIVEDYVDRRSDGDGNTISPTSLYTEGYTYATMSYLAEQYETGLRTHQDLYNILKFKDSSFVKLEASKKLKNLGGKAWFDSWMHSLYRVIYNTKISVSNLKYKDYSDIFMRIEDELRDDYLKGYYDEGTRLPLGTGEQSKYFLAVLEAGDNFFPSQTSATQSGTQSDVNTDYILSVINPLSDIEKKIEGKIVFIEAGNYIIPNSTLNGLPNPWTNPKTNVVVPNNTGTITFNGGKSTSSKNNLATDAILALQNIIEGTYGLAIYLKYTEPAGPPVVPPSDSLPGSSASTVTGASESSIPGATASTVGTQEFTFNVEQLDIFSNADFGNLFIIGQEDETLLYDDGTDIYGSEYVEDEFSGSDEISAELIQEDNINIEALNDIKGFNPENPDPALSTDTGSPYPIPKNKQANIDAIVTAMKKKGVTNKFAQAAILAIVSKESAFVPQNEASYAKTSATRIKSIFSKFRKYSDSEVDRIKKIPKEFFDIIYGGKYGNSTSEGYNYRGRGCNQLTFKAGYEEAQKKTGHKIVTDPDLVNTIQVASDCLVVYFLQRMAEMPSKFKTQYNFSGNINDFKTLNDATGAIYHANAGWGNSYSLLVADSTGGRKKAFSAAPSLYKNLA